MKKLFSLGLIAVLAFAGSAVGQPVFYGDENVGAATDNFDHWYEGTPTVLRMSTEDVKYEFSGKTVDIPFILYYVPGRTVVNMEAETVARWAEIPNIVGIKEATGSLAQASDVIGLCPEDFTVLSGEDSVVFPMYSVGGRGVISVTANVVPKDMAEMCDAAEEGDWQKARNLHYKLRPLSAAMFYEANPIPVKTALSLMGKIQGDLRLPLSQMGERSREKLVATMKMYGLMN